MKCIVELSRPPLFLKLFLLPFFFPIFQKVLDKTEEENIVTENIKNKLTDNDDDADVFCFFARGREVVVVFLLLLLLLLGLSRKVDWWWSSRFALFLRRVENTKQPREAYLDGDESSSDDGDDGNEFFFFFFRHGRGVERGRHR